MIFICILNSRVDSNQSQKADKIYTNGKIYTLNEAYALQIDDVSGSIEEGKFADMIIIDRNIFEIPKNEIHLTEVLKTLFKGQVVFEKETGGIGME